MKNRVKMYREIIDEFLSGEIQAIFFERTYIDLFKRDDNIYPDDIYNILNSIFIACDEYIDVGDLAGNALDEKEFRDAVCRYNRELELVINKQTRSA